MRTNHDVRDLKATARNSWRFLLVAILASVIGCDGDNIFGSDPKVVGSPEITELTLPESVESDKVLDLRVRAKSGRNIEQISLILREARDLDSIIAISPPRQEVVEDIAIRFPQAVRDTILVVRVTATDVVGGMSEAVEDTVRIIDATPPTVRLEVTNAPVGAGEEAEIRVEAEDNIGLREIGYLILTESGDTVTFELAQVAGSNHDSTFVFTVPDTLQLQSIRVVGVATDIGGQLGVAADPVSLDVRDVTPPAVRFAQPQAGAAYAAGDRIRIEVEAEDAGGLASIQVVGQAFRGDPDIGTDVVVTRYTSQTINFASAPADTSLMRFLVPTDDRTPEVVYLIATAHDASGNQSTDTIQVNVGTPRVEILAPAEGAGLESGVDVEVRVRATDPTGIEHIELFYDGVVEGTRTHEVASPSANVEWVDTISIPTNASGQLRLEVHARNTLGIVGKLDPQVHGVGDRTPPTVRIAGPADGTAYAAGDTIMIEVEAEDAGGLESIQLVGQAFRGDRELGTDVVVPRYASQTVRFSSAPADTSLKRFLIATDDRSPEVVYLIATARDISGNQTTDTIQVNVSTPQVDVVAPAGGAGLESGVDVEVRVRVEDPFDVEYLELVYSGIVEGTLTHDVSPAASSVEWEPTITLPADVSGELTIEIRARNALGITGTSGPRTYGVGDRTPPTVRIVEPEGGDQTRPIGDTITVEIEAADAGGLASVELMGVAYRPDPSLGPDIEVVRYQRQIIELEPMPTDTTVRRRLFPTNDDTAERVFFIATVRDKAGNVATDTVALSVGGPRVEILDPVPGTQVQSGGPFTVRISAEDDNNLSRIVLHYDGVVEGTQTFPVNPPSTSVLWEPEIVLPAGAEGTLELRAVAHSTAAIEPGRTGTVTVAVQTDAAPDDTPPFVGLTLDVPQRMEMTDSVRARVTAHDPNGSGVKHVGITVLALNGADTLSITRSIDFPIARRGMTVQNIAFAPFNVDPFALPDSVIFEVHAFAVDDAGNCAAAVEASDQQLACADYAGDIIADGVSGQRTDEILVVAGRTVLLPAGGTIADAVVDTVRQRLYLSNISRNSVEVLDLDANRFDFLGTPVGVGSQPWGLFLGGDGDTLIVANSGGTNISTVDLDLLTEERFRTPNIVLYQVRITVDETTALESLSAEFIDFSDRPQFVAQDSVGRILYSTVPTGAAPDGTIRVATTDPTYDEPEVRLLFNTDAVTPADEAIVIANVDSVKVYQVTGSHDVIEIFDHVPGFPDNLIRSGRLRLFDAIEEMELRGSDIFHHAGTWIRDRIGMSDTTYVSASGDRGRIAFGEGATAPTGRIVLWNAEDASISNEVSVADLVGNASERVTGVDLNLNGSLGVARGRDAAYFFTNNLRLEGMFADGLQGGGVGAALHPYHDHPDADASGSGLAFVGTDRGSIAIIDSYFFRQVGEIQLRDRIIGPLRSSPPLPGDNAGRVCPGDPDCVVVKLYGITSAGGVVVVDVRRRDLDI